MSHQPITTFADVEAAQRAVLARQHAELQARIALARAGRSPAQLKAEEDRILADLDAALSAPVMVPQQCQQQQACAKRHPSDGKPRFDYVESKVSHLKRAGLASKEGYGRNGGAAPDWLVQQQREETEAANNRQILAARRQQAAYAEVAE